MRNVLIAGGLFSLGIRLMLVAALLSSAVERSFAQPIARTPITPTQIAPTVIFVSTYQMGATPTAMLAEESDAEGSCVPLSQNEVDFPEVFDGPPDYLLEQVLTYFNAGGSTQQLDEIMSNQFYPHPVPEWKTRYLWQIVEQDVTGDAIPEIFFTVTIPWTPGYADSYLWVFSCKDDHYEGAFLWGHGGAGSIGEGLYDGGGTRVLSVDDLNDNGYKEVLFRVGWEWDLSSGAREYAEYYLVEWRDSEWVALWEEVNELGEAQRYVIGNTVAGLEIVDQDDDGVYEIVIDDRTYRWDGEMYVLVEGDEG